MYDEEEVYDESFSFCSFFIYMREEEESEDEDEEDDDDEFSGLNF